MAGWQCRWCADSGRPSVPATVIYRPLRSDKPRMWIACAYCDSLGLWPNATQRKADTRG